MLGWRARDILFLHAHDQMIEASAEMAARINAGEIDPATVANVRLAGTTRCLLRQELVPDAIWKHSWVPTEYQIPRGIHDQLVSANALDTRHESYVGLTRGASERRFGRPERNALLLFMQSSRRFHRRIMLFRGLLGTPALTEREQDVLRLLVTAGSEKEIARALGIGERTVHQHAFVIYRKLGVHGRIGLLSFVA
jgi:DNA-binding CsgD family transcriptional regulator